MAVAETYLKTNEVAKLLDIQPQTLAIWRLRKQGPPFVKLGRSVRYPESALQQWLKSQTVATEG